MSPAARAPRSRSLMGNFSLLTGGRITADLFLFVALVVLARLFGAGGMGEYSFAIAYTGFFAVFCDWGLSTLTIKELSRLKELDPGGEQFKPFLDGIFALRVALSALVSLALVLSTLVLPFSGEQQLIVLLIGAYQFIHRIVFGFSSLFIAQEQTQTAAAIDSSFSASVALGTIGAALISRNLLVTIAVFPAVALIHAVCAYVVVAQRHGPLRLLAPPSRLLGVYRSAVPFGLSNLVSQLNARTDVVLLGFLVGAEAAGAYNVAYRSVMLPMVLPVFFGLAVLPVGARLFVGQKSELQALFNRAANWIVLLGVPAAFGIWVIAPPAIRLIFGEEFEASIGILRILSVLMLIAAANRVLTMFMVATDREVLRVRSQWTAAATNVGANLLLIPLFGAPGAACALVLSESLLCGLYTFGLRGPVGVPRVASRLAISTVASLAFFVPLVALQPLPLLVVLPAAILIYFGVLCLFRDVRTNEIRALVGMVKRA